MQNLKIIFGFLALILSSYLWGNTYNRPDFASIPECVVYPLGTKINDILEHPYSLVVLNISKDGSDEKKYDVEKIKELKQNGKYVLALLNLDEIQSYQFYWQEDWFIGHPKFIADQISSQDFKVKFWKDGFKKRVIRRYLNRVLEQGFDGVYLLNVDGYRDWTDEDASITKRSRQMARLIHKIYKYGNKRVSRDFLICIQNGLYLTQEAPEPWLSKLMKFTKGYSYDSAFYHGQDLSYLNQILVFLNNNGKKIFTIIYYSFVDNIPDDPENPPTDEDPEEPYYPPADPPPDYEEPVAYLGMSVPSSTQIFTSNSPWNTPIPSNPELDPNSGTMINTLDNMVGNLVVDSYQWSIPVHVINSQYAPKVDVPTTGSGLYESVDPDGNDIAEDIPIPPECWPDPKEDGHMSIIDLQLRKVWDFSRAQKLSNNQWQASIVDVWDLDSDGFRAPFSGQKWWRSGAMGSGLPLITSVVRVEEIEAGHITHALMCATPVNRKSTINDGSYELMSPASRSNGEGIGVQYIPEGARIQLDPNLNLDSLGLTPESKIVARALQEYGMFCGENSSDFKLFFQNLGSDNGKWKYYNFNLYKIPIQYFRILKLELVTGS